MVGTLLAMSLLTVAQTPDGETKTLDDSLRMRAILEWGMHETPLIDPETIERLCTEAIDKKQLLPGRTCAEYYQQRGIARMHLEKYGEAIEDFERVLHEQPKNVEARYAFGYCHFIINVEKASDENPQKIPKAQETIVHLLEEEPDSALGYYLGGCLLSSALRRDEAKVYFTKAIELNPRFRAAYAHRYFCHTGEDRYERKLKDIERAMLLPSWRPDSTPLRAFRALALAEIGRYQEAYEDYLEALKEQPESLAIQVGLWNSSAQLGRLGSCAVVAADMLKAHPEDSVANRHMALSLALFGRWDEALPLAKKAVDLESTHAVTTGDCAKLLMAAGKPLEAAKHFAETLRRKGNQAEWQMRYAFLLASCPVDEVRDGTRAKELARAAVGQFRRGRFRGLALMVLAAAHAECPSQIMDLTCAEVPGGGLTNFLTGSPPRNTRMKRQTIVSKSDSVLAESQGFEFRLSARTPGLRRMRSNRRRVLIFAFAALASGCADTLSSFDERHPYVPLAYRPLNVSQRWIREGGDVSELQLQAWASFDAGERRKAAQILSKAIDVAQSASPQDELLLSQLYLERGMFQWYLEEYRSAIEDYSAAIALRPDHWEGYYHRRQTYLKLGDAVHAAEDQETGMRLRPDIFSSEYMEYLHQRGVI